MIWRTAEGCIDAFRGQKNRAFEAQGLAGAKELRLEGDGIEGEKLVEGGDLLGHGDLGVEGRSVRAATL